MVMNVVFKSIFTIQYLSDHLCWQSKVFFDGMWG